MQIFIMRHGQAQMHANSDEERALSNHGKHEVQRMADYIASQGISFDAIFQSPYLRAQQTAHIVAKKLDLADRLLTLDLITPDGNAQHVHDYIDGLLAEQPYDNILLVCHMPIVSYIVESLTSGAASPIFQTASVAQVAYNPNSCIGELVALNAPIIS